jgi:hypothetical protein
MVWLWKSTGGFSSKRQSQPPLDEGRSSDFEMEFIGQH